MLLLSVALVFPYISPLGSSGKQLGIEVAVCKDKSLEAKPEKVAELLTQYCILRLTDLLVISAKGQSDLRGQYITVLSSPLFYSIVKTPHCQFPLLFESPSPYGLIYPFLIGRVGER